MRAVLLSIVLVLAGCGPSESEKAAKERISAAAHAKWSDGIDAAGLADSLRLCAAVQSRDCIEVEARAQAVADAVASCVGNDSQLCQAVSNTQSLRQFKGGAATPLPDHPFYWDLGNQLLDAQAALGYRREMWDGWLKRWRVVLLAVLGAIAAALVGWVWWSWQQAEAEEQAQTEAARKAQEARQNGAQEYAKAEGSQESPGSRQRRRRYPEKGGNSASSRKRSQRRRRYQASAGRGH